MVEQADPRPGSATSRRDTYGVIANETTRRRCVTQNHCGDDTEMVGRGEMSGRITKAEILEKWKVHEWPREDKLTPLYYVGPVHGRSVIASYETKAEAKVAIEMQRWMIKKFGLTE